jgi:hypothetical protein
VCGRGVAVGGRVSRHCSARKEYRSVVSACAHIHMLGHPSDGRWDGRRLRRASGGRGQSGSRGRECTRRRGTERTGSMQLQRTAYSVQRGRLDRRPEQQHKTRRDRPAARTPCCRQARRVRVARAALRLPGLDLEGGFGDRRWMLAMGVFL